jgi:hypothetical protein
MSDNNLLVDNMCFDLDEKAYRPGQRMFAVSLKVINQHFWRPGMDTLALNADERVASVKFSSDFLTVGLMDGRQISVPLKWYPRLAGASSDALSKWEICSGGYGVHWPGLDEDLSTEGLLRGAPAPNASVK